MQGRETWTGLGTQKAAYNKVYRKTTFSLWDLLKQKVHRPNLGGFSLYAD